MEERERVLRKTKGTVGVLIAPKAARRQDTKTGALPDQTGAPKPETDGMPREGHSWRSLAEMVTSLLRVCINSFWCIFVRYRYRPRRRST